MCNSWKIYWKHKLDPGSVILLARGGPNFMVAHSIRDEKSKKNVKGDTSYLKFEIRKSCSNYCVERKNEPHAQNAPV